MMMPYIATIAAIAVSLLQSQPVLGVESNVDKQQFNHDHKVFEPKKKERYVYPEDGEFMEESSRRIKEALLRQFQPIMEKYNVQPNEKIADDSPDSPDSSAKTKAKVVMTPGENDVYFGEVNKGEMHGKGFYIDCVEDFPTEQQQEQEQENGDISISSVFYGEFKMGEMRFGRYMDEHGVYIGDFRNGKKDGVGHAIHNDGYSYRGEFRNGKQHGDGFVTLPNGLSYYGRWRHGQPVHEGSWKEMEGNIMTRGDLTFHFGNFWDIDFPASNWGNQH